MVGYKADVEMREESDEIKSSCLFNVYCNYLFIGEIKIKIKIKKN